LLCASSPFLRLGEKKSKVLLVTPEESRNGMNFAEPKNEEFLSFFSILVPLARIIHEQRTCAARPYDNTMNVNNPG
jgi:hypothetical protein